MFDAFDRFSLPDVAVVSRRTVIGALVAGVIGIVALLFASMPWAAVGLGMGLGLGLLNFRLIMRSVVRVGERAGEHTRRPLALNTLGRMGLLTVIALGMLFIEPQLGFGLLGGLALFQLLLLVNVTRAMLRPAGGPAGAIDAEAEELGPAPGRTPVEVPDDGPRGELR